VFRPATLLLSLVLAAVGADAAPRPEPLGKGPFLDALVAPPVTASRTSVRTETWMDVPATVFLPGKADPSEWMATGTWARITLDGFSWQYGYDPLTQTYDMMVSGYVDAQTGILAQETVGIMAMPLPEGFQSGQVERVEVWFRVKEHNLFPFEMVGITAMTDTQTPRSNLNSLQSQLLYEDARGFSGTAYALDHFDAGPHAIDLGPIAVEDLEDRLDSDRWFGVGFAADGWDLSGSLGQQVFWRVDGGGALPESNRPFFRVVYNAPPDAAEPVAPVTDALLSTTRPRFEWTASTDPNDDTPITYRVLVGTDPLLTDPIVFDAGTETTAEPPVALAPGTLYWAVEASDPAGALRRSTVTRFAITTGTDAPATARNTPLTAAPNPFNPRTSITATLPVAGQWSLTVFDPRGRRIRSLASAEFPAGRHDWTWNGLDESGTAVGSGVYTAVLRGPRNHRTSTRLTLVR